MKKIVKERQAGHVMSIKAIYPKAGHAENQARQKAIRFAHA